MCPIYRLVLAMMVRGLKIPFGHVIKILKIMCFEELLSIQIFRTGLFYFESFKFFLFFCSVLFVLREGLSAIVQYGLKLIIFMHHPPES